MPNINQTAEVTNPEIINIKVTANQASMISDLIFDLDPHSFRYHKLRTVMHNLNEKIQDFK